MVGKLLVRGMLAGIAAGLLTFSFARLVGEPQMEVARKLVNHPRAPPLLPETGAHARTGSAITNFEAILRPGQAC